MGMKYGACDVDYDEYNGDVRIVIETILLKPMKYYFLMCVYHFPVPSQVEWSGVSVFRRERGSNDLSVLLTWAELTSEQAGGALTSYRISLYIISSSTRTLVSMLLLVVIMCEHS